MSKFLLWLAVSVLLSLACSDNGQDSLLTPESRDNQMVVVYTDKYLHTEISVPLYSLRDTVFARDHVVGSVYVPVSVVTDEAAFRDFKTEYGKKLSAYTTAWCEPVTMNDTEVLLTFYNYSLPENWAGVIVFEDGTVEYHYDSIVILHVARNTNRLP